MPWATDYYYWIVYHLGHERNVFPELGIASDEKVTAAALPKIANALDVLERELGHGRGFLIAEGPTLADFAMLPMMTSLTFHKEGQDMLAGKPRIRRWKESMEALPSVAQFRASLPPRTPIWARARMGGVASTEILSIGVASTEILRR